MLPWRRLCESNIDDLFSISIFYSIIFYKLSIDEERPIYIRITIKETEEILVKLIQCTKMVLPYSKTCNFVAKINLVFALFIFIVPPPLCLVLCTFVMTMNIYDVQDSSPLPLDSIMWKCDLVLPLELWTMDFIDFS